MLINNVEGRISRSPSETSLSGGYLSNMILNKKKYNNK